MEARLNRIEANQARMEANQVALARALAQNTRVTEESRATNEEVRAILSAGKTGLRVLGGLGTAARWLASIAAAIAALKGGIYWMDHH